MARVFTAKGNSKINMLIDVIIDRLFQAEKRRLAHAEVSFVKRNKEASGGNFDGFFYQGKLFSELQGNLSYKGLKTGLHLSLVPEMDAFMKDKAEVSFDQRRIKQALVLVLTDCRTLQDMRDALPNGLAELIPELLGISRTRPEAWTLENDQRRTEQYFKLREKVEFYLAARLLY